MKCGCEQVDCPYNSPMPLTSDEIAKARARGKERREKAAKFVTINIIEGPEQERLPRPMRLYRPLYYR